MGDQSFFKKLKNRLFSNTYSLRRIFTASEKSLKVAQEVREIGKELRANSVELINTLRTMEFPAIKGDSARPKAEQIPFELESLARAMVPGIVKSSHPYYTIVYLFGSKLVVEWATDKRHVSMSIRHETTFKYLKDALALLPLEPSQQLFFFINLEDSCYDGPFSSFVWNFCGKNPTQGFVWPNNYAQGDFDGKLAKPDNLSWEDKGDNCCFYGSSTGDIDPAKNVRVQTCLLAHKAKSSVLTAKITDWVQMDTRGLPFEKAAISSPFVSIEDQLKSKIVLSIDGNVTAWDRIAWVLNSNSLLFKFESDYYDWFYDHLIDEHNYILIRRGDDLIDKIEYYLKNESISKQITARANELVRNHLIYERHLQFSRWLLTSYNERYFG